MSAATRYSGLIQTSLPSPQVTGTAKQHVADDYNTRIAAGREEADAVVRQGLEAMLLPRCGSALGDHRMRCLWRQHRARRSTAAAVPHCTMIIVSVYLPFHRIVPSDQRRPDVSSMACWHSCGAQCAQDHVTVGYRLFAQESKAKATESIAQGGRESWAAAVRSAQHQRL